MQIAQFLFGASYAALHLFVQYDIPIATPYKVLATVSSVAASATSAVASASSEVSKIVESPAAPSVGALIKKFLLRAAGEEGIAERVGIPHDNKPVSQHIEERIAQVTQHAIPAGPKYETRWRTEWTKVNCIDTSGEAFAIYLNLFYLFPLTVLFARFFYKAYMKRTTRPRGASQNAKAIAQDARTAEKETEKAIEAAGKRAEDKVRNSGSKAQEKVRDYEKELREDLKKVKEGGKFQGRRVSLAVENFEQKVQNVAESLGDNGSPASTPKKSSPKKKNNKNNKQGGDDSRPSTPLKSSETTNEPDVKDDLAPKVDLKPENEAASTETEKSDVPEPSDKENQPPTTPSRKQKKKKNAQLKKEQEEQSPATPDHKQEKDSEPKEDTDADDSQSGLLSPSKEGEKPTAETEKVPAEDESAEKQDANLEATEPTRPAPENKESRIPDDLSQSASFINYEDAMRTSQTEDEGLAKSTA
jgi:F0F1-type ATP synthase membrane subunit b/b'